MTARKVTLEMGSMDVALEMQGNVIPFPTRPAKRVRMTEEQRAEKLRRQREEEREKARVVRKRQAALILAMFFRLLPALGAKIQALPTRVYRGICTLLQCTIILTLFIALTIFAYAFLFSALGYCFQLFAG